jgi:hypothetical protein
MKAARIECGEGFVVLIENRPRSSLAPGALQLGLCHARAREIQLRSAAAKRPERGFRLPRQDAHERDRCGLHRHPILFPIP